MPRPHFFVIEAAMSFGDQLATIRHASEYQRGPDGRLVKDERGWPVAIFSGFAASISRSSESKVRKVVFRKKLADLRRVVERDMLRHVGATKP